MTPRIATSVLAGALVRRAQAEGGFAAVLAKGDEQAGALLVLVTERGERRAALERVLDLDGRYVWRESGPVSGVLNADEDRRFLERRRGSDPDLWILELDVASAERFVAEMNELD